MPAHVEHNLQLALAIRFVVWGIVIWQLAAVWRTGNRTGAALLLAALAINHVVYRHFWEELVVALVLLLYVRLLREGPMAVEFALVAISTGLLFLVKFSAFVPATLMLAVYSAKTAVTWRERTVRELALVGLAWVSGPLAYLIYSPSLHNLMLSRRGFQEISLGYTETMSLATGSEPAFLAAAVCGLIGVAVAIGIRSRAMTWTGAGVITAFTWSIFRHGFTRSDTYHQADFFYLAPLAMAAALALTTIGTKKLLWHASTFVALLAISVPAANARWKIFPQSPWVPNFDLIPGLSILDWGETMKTLDARTAAKLASAPVAPFLPKLDDTRVLMFPYNLAYAAQSKIDLFPTYALQNYDNYTGYLDEQSAFGSLRHDTRNCGNALSGGHALEGVL
jgi:hypothetical protein